LDTVGDVIPAGTGMKDVQLLIVSREDRNRLCGIGEPGEILVRAGGLASGYLGIEELTRRKFIPNPFVGSAERHKKDFVYVSGDVGIRRPDGFVECIGLCSPYL
jgi:L-2-aminoadipate reductase